MTAATMKIPTNGATRLSTQTWVEAEALKRFMGADSVRRVIELLVAEAINENLVNQDFAEVLKAVRAEDIEGNKR
jgi:uncharacterized membrane-anchored protein YjiN (DUF445 family)